LRFDALVFDFDGVLVESVDAKTRAFEQLYAAYGPGVRAKVVAYHLEHGGKSRYEKFRHFHHAFLGKPLSAAEEASLGQQFSALVEDSVVQARWIAGAREFLEAHHERLPLFVASGTPDDELKRIIDRRGMTRYFRDARGSPASKADILAGFVTGHGLNPGRVLMVGDSRTDLAGAQEAGVQFLGVSPAPSDVFPGTVQVVPDLRRLEEFLSRQTLAQT